MKDFIYHIPTKVYFGPDQWSHLGEEIRRYGKNVLFIYSSNRIKKNGVYDTVLKASEQYQFALTEFTKVAPNPRHTDIQEAVNLCKKTGCDIILAVGGGSVMDSAKAIATCSLLDAPVWDVITGKVATKGSLPIIVVPTTAATGSEMNIGAVISNLETKEKQSLRIESQRPKAAFLDPVLTETVPAYQTACGSVDILCHTIESYFSSNDCMEYLDNLMHGIVRTVCKYGPIAFEQPDNYDARANLMWAAPWAINDLIRGDKECGWTIHPLEHEISAFYDITHGLGLAILMPRYLKFIMDEKSLPRFRTLGIYGFDISPNGSDEDIAEKVIKKIEILCYETFGLASSFSSIGITDQHFEEMADRLTNNGSSYFEGYRKLTKQDILSILNSCL